MNNKKILVIDAEQGLRDMLAYELGSRGYGVVSVETGNQGIEKAENEEFDLAIIDVKMPGLDGVKTLEAIKKIDPDIEVIMATGYGTIETAVECMKKGAYDYINKPFDIEELSILIQKVLEKKDLKIAVALYRASKVIYSSLNVKDLLDEIISLLKKVIKADDISVLLFNEDKKLSFAASYNVDKEFKKRNRLKIGECIIGKIVKERKPIILNDGSEDYTGLAGIMGEEKLKSAIVCPLSTKSRTWGLINLNRINVADNFTHADAQNVTVFATQISQAIENAYLYKGLENKLEELEKTHRELNEAIALQKKAEKNLKHLAFHDILTDLPNRVLLNDRIFQAISKAKRSNYLVAILLLDLDRFKEVNDTLGHDAGDCLLKEVSGRLKNFLRRYDSVARMGGDEFVLVFTEIENKDDIHILAQRVLGVFEEPIEINNRELHITTSIGISIFPDNGDTIEILLKNADIAMYSAKKHGGNTFCFFESNMGKISEEKITIKNNLIQAIEKDEFVLHYQPLVEIDTGNIISVEALIRWVHPDRGIIQPLHFINIAETTGLIIPIGDWVLHTACIQCKRWQDAGYNLPVSVNISTHQLYDTGLLHKIMEILETTGLSPHNLILEITEGSGVRDIENTFQVIERLHQSGIQFFLDDFGSGYSTFNWLKTLSVEAIKINRLFIQNIADDPFDAAIVLAIISMAHSLNIKVIAKGVENKEQLSILKSLKYPANKTLMCDMFQGFLFSKPVSANELTQLLESRLKPLL